MLALSFIDCCQKDIRKGVYGHTLKGLNNNMAVRFMTKHTTEFGSRGLLGIHRNLTMGMSSLDRMAERTRIPSLKWQDVPNWKHGNSSTFVEHHFWQKVCDTTSHSLLLFFIVPRGNNTLVPGCATNWKEQIKKNEGSTRDHAYDRMTVGYVLIDDC